MAQEHDYRVIPAPARGEKAKGVKGPAEQFAHALTQTMNRMAAEGWEYLRAETLPCEERDGWFGRKTTQRHMLVFRRPVRNAAPAAAPATPAPAALPLAGPSLAAPASVAAPSLTPASTPEAEPRAEAPRTPGGMQALEWARRRAAEPPLMPPRPGRPAAPAPRPRAPDDDG
ncbi:MAG: hypothetical protein RLZ26_1000 [Pseudomonadota bacterium]|jgi:hypothetical protein